MHPRRGDRETERRPAVHRLPHSDRVRQRTALLPHDDERGTVTPENLATMEPDEREEYLREHPQEPEPTPAPTISDAIRAWLAQAKQEHDAAEPYDHTC